MKVNKSSINKPINHTIIISNPLKVNINIYNSTVNFPKAWIKILIIPLSYPRTPNSYDYTFKINIINKN